MLRASYALVQATVGVGTVIIPYIGVAFPMGGSYCAYTEASLLQHFCSRMRQCYSHSHPSIATSRRRIIAWKRQGAFLLDYYDTLLETRHTRKDHFWAKFVRALRHQSMPALTQVAAELLRENRSTLEDLFRAAAATVHRLKKRSQPCGPETSNPKRICVPPSPPNTPESELW